MARILTFSGSPTHPSRTNGVVSYASRLPFTKELAVATPAVVLPHRQSAAVAELVAGRAS